MSSGSIDTVYRMLSSRHLIPSSHPAMSDPDSGCNMSDLDSGCNTTNPDSGCNMSVPDLIENPISASNT
jgi:hypothetical protein